MFEKYLLKKKEKGKRKRETVGIFKMNITAIKYLNCL